MHIPGLMRLRLVDRKILQLIYGFNKWHISKRFQRPYVNVIINYLNSRPSSQRESICEIGVGLGDILRNVNYGRKMFFESDEKVLKACQFLSHFRNKGKGSAKFSLFNFPDDQLSGSYDAILLVNWIHAIPPETLNKNLIRYYSEHLKKGGCIVTDSVEDNFANFHHDFAEFIYTSGVAKKQIGPDFVFGRKIWAFEKP